MTTHVGKLSVKHALSIVLSFLDTRVLLIAIATVSGSACLLSRLVQQDECEVHWSERTVSASVVQDFSESDCVGD